MILTNAVSRLFGKFATTKFPPFLQKLINKTYVKLMHLDMSEFQDPNRYETLNKLFTRKLLQNRVFEEGFISPVDAFITKAGSVKDGELFQIKGHSYSLDALLTDNYSKELIASLEGGKYANFYLSPKDYHRYHIPFDMRIKSATYVPGKLYPVNFTYLQKVPHLFTQNERVVIECEVEGKTVFMVLVGALNVGKMVVHFEQDIHTNAQVGKVVKYSYENLHLKKGEEFGYFMMGSTVVIIAQKESLELSVHESTRVKFGEKIAEIV
ncbi:MAG: phosphatidylserine decarboxylase [Campylobacterota bacterium]